jgi:hypothetical protein
MAIYKLTAYGVLKSGKEHIGNSLDNPGWREFQRWLADGNTPDPADPEVPLPTPDPTDPDKIPREARTILKVIADITGTPLNQVKAKFRAMS